MQPLFTRDFDGLVIKPDISGIQVLKENDDWVEIEAGAAEDWDNFVAFCVSRGFAGVENLSLIPGTVGAAPIQNIGAYGTEVKDVITRVEAVNSVSGNRESFTNAACGFTYRNSIFKETRRFVITSVIFRLQKIQLCGKICRSEAGTAGESPPSLQEVRDAVIRIRTRKLPDHLKLPNAGSFSKIRF